MITSIPQHLLQVDIMQKAKVIALSPYLKTLIDLEPLPTTIPDGAQKNDHLNDLLRSKFAKTSFLLNHEFRIWRHRHSTYGDIISIFKFQQAVTRAYNSRLHMNNDNSITAYLFCCLNGPRLYNAVT